MGGGKINFWCSGPELFTDSSFYMTLLWGKKFGNLNQATSSIFGGRKLVLGKPSHKKNGQTWEKVQTSFTPSLPPSTWELLTVIFLLHIWALKTMKWILR